MNKMDPRLKLMCDLDKQIETELKKLQIPQDYNDTKKKILDGREEDFGLDSSNVSGNEVPTYRNLWLNNAFRARELRRAMGMVLLYSDIGPINLYPLDLSNHPANYSEHFWVSYGDFQIRSYSFLDSIGGYLAFAFLGIIDVPLYFNQVFEAIKLKYARQKRKVLDGEPFKVEGRESWKVLERANERYKKVRIWRDEVIHVFSPVMYTRFNDDYFDKERLQILRTPTLEASKALEECTMTYSLLKLVPIAACDIAVAFINSGSYHRNYCEGE